MAALWVCTLGNCKLVVLASKPNANVVYSGNQIGYGMSRVGIFPDKETMEKEVSNLGESFTLPDGEIFYNRSAS